MSEETSCLRIISYLTLKNSHIIMLKSEKQSFYPTLKLWRKWNLESHFYGKKSSLAFQSGGLILAESPFKESLLFPLDAFFRGWKGSVAYYYGTNITKNKKRERKTVPSEVARCSGADKKSHKNKGLKVGWRYTNNNVILYCNSHTFVLYTL